MMQANKTQSRKIATIRESIAWARSAEDLAFEISERPLAAVGGSAWFGSFDFGGSFELRTSRYSPNYFPKTHFNGMTEAPNPISPPRIRAGQMMASFSTPMRTPIMPNSMPTIAPTITA